MGSILRKQKRNTAKIAYKKFKKNFSGAKKMQMNMSLAEKRRADMDGQKILGRCPTFQQWLEAVRIPAQFTAQPEDVQDHIESLDWDED